jgi:diaminohydroxyphosphoribosylaminopyrimidine deaminase/5-amino-6-(5-phosphoribosylamino)uracil reductase
MLMPSDDDLKFMKRCLDLAGRAEGRTYPNPLVGSVIVHNGSIIGEGYHLKAGEPHAERIAINSASDRGLLINSTLYVNLEPCSHFGKTPPCTELIISSGIKKIVAGTTDTSDKVNGNGFTTLRGSGCVVITGVLENECRRINRRFFTFHEKKRPYIVLKWAQSSDGFLDVERDRFTGRRPTWITGKAERVLVHRWRASEQAILAGAGTIRADNPMLNLREWPGEDPLRLILSSSGKLDKGSAIFRPDGKAVVFTHNESVSGCFERVILDRKRSSALQVAEYLYNAGVQSLFIEGGAGVLNHFISEDLWDEARVFSGKITFGSGIKAPVVKGIVLSRTEYSESHLEVITKADNQRY